MSAVIQADAPMRRGDNRAFNTAVLFSLLLHAALLFSFSLRPPKSPPANLGPIVARLQPPQSAPAAPPQPVQPEPPKPRVEEPPPPPPQVKPVPQPKPSPIARPEPKPAPAAKPQPAPQPPQAQPAPPVATPAPAAPAAPGPVARTEPAPVAPSPDVGSVDTYRIELMALANRKFRRYPRVAIDNNWEGRAVVRLVVGANGMISSLTVITSAGHEVLDKQAIDMIQKAKGGVQIPPALRGKEFTLEIPVIYDLKEAGAG